MTGHRAPRRPGTTVASEGGRDEGNRDDGDSGAGAGAGAELDRGQAAFLRSVTHDLRTPLAAIRAIVTDLHDGPEHDAATTSDLLQTVCDEVDRLDRLVGNLLRMSAIEAGALQPETQAIEVAELIDHRIKVLSPLLRDHVVVAAVDESCPLARADYGQLDEVLTNLLGNAVRHAPPGSTITVSCGAGGHDDVVITVADHGPGIDAEVRTQLRQPFARGAGSRSSGLGLAICDAIVAAHGGALSIGDTPGGGTTISFTVPAVAS
jgi:two-component system sensor histidine kinase KdpD